MRQRIGKYDIKVDFHLKKRRLLCPVIKFCSTKTNNSETKYFSRMIDHFKNLFSQMIVVRQNQIIEMGIFGTDALMSLLFFLKLIDEEIL